MLLVGASAMTSWQRLIAQTTQRTPRIGFLRPAPPPEGALEAFRGVLVDNGYVPGQNCDLGYFWGDGNLDHLPELASKLVKSGIDLVVVDSLVATRAARAATATIPIVMAGGADRVRAGLVESLSRPGGNTTGITSQANDIVGKGFQLLSEIVPRLSRVAVIDAPSGRDLFGAADTEAA